MKTVYIERNKLLKNIKMIMLNNINEIDESFIENNTEIFFHDCDECKGSGIKNAIGEECDECGGEGQFSSEPYQFFLVDVNELYIDRLKSYGVKLGYSEKLEKYILPIYDFGTSWSCFSYSKEVNDNYKLRFDETLTRSTVY